MSPHHLFMEYFKFLPLEITLDILTRLPVETVLHCKSVCKTWNNVTRHPSFNKMHFRRFSNPDFDSGKSTFLAKTRLKNYGDDKLQYFEYDDNQGSKTVAMGKIRRVNLTLPFEFFTFLGSHNGLICIAESPSEIHGAVCICNPISKEYVMLPEIKTDWDIGRRYVFLTTGYGYISSTNEYKIVKIVLTAEFEYCDVYIYTLGSGNGWRYLGKLNSKFRSYPWEQGIFVNGALYWIDIEQEVIVIFDLADEKFCVSLSPPTLPPNSNWINHKIGVLDEHLFFAIGGVFGRSRCYKICIMKKRNDNSFCWSKKLKIYNSELLAVTKSHGVVTYTDDILCIYDREASTTVRLGELKERIHEVFHHKNTLVSLKELGEEDTKTMKSV